MKSFISGIQQVGVGVADAETSFKWHIKHFGFNVPMFKDENTATHMAPYMGGKPQQKKAILALNLQGGGGLEIWQYAKRTPLAADFEILAGDLGIFVCKIKSRDVEAAYLALKNKNAALLGGVSRDPHGNPHFFVQDNYGNIYEVTQEKSVFMKGDALTAGVCGVIIGVSDMDKAIEFYKNILGFDEIIYQKQGSFDDMKVIKGGNLSFKRTLLTHKEPRKGPFAELLGKNYIELWQVEGREPHKIYANRQWGDLGFIHLCFDVKGMDTIRQICMDLKFPFTVDTGSKFEMGEAAGRFAYLEDPDGTLIELVETYKIPILKKINWYLDLTKRNPESALPKWMLKALRFSKVKD